MEPGRVPFSDTATVKDLLYCYRLLHGRQPGRDEWQAELARLGGPLHALVARHMREAGAARLPAPAEEAPRLAEFPGFRIFARAGDAAVGKHVLAGSYEPEVAAVFRRALRPGMGVIDLGANIGFFSMLSASLVGPQGYVLAVEPNLSNVRLIAASRIQNGFDQIHIAQMAAAPRAGMLVLHASYSAGSTSAAPDDAAALLESDTVLCARPDALVPPGRRVDLVKVDVDGADYRALLGCTEIVARDRPTIVAEFAPGLLPGLSGVSGPEYLRWLIGLGYVLSVIRHDGGLDPAGENWQRVMEEHRRRGTDHVDIVASPRLGAAPT